MDLGLFGTRLNKLFVSIGHPFCWRALSYGVAPSVEHLQLLCSLKIDGIIDVGANRGQFTLACRLAQSNVPIVAFEPIPDEAEIFRKIHGQIPKIEAIECAIGNCEGTATLHLSRSADSSSLLPISKLQSEVFRNTEEIDTLTVTVRRLDDFSSNWSGRTSQLLKLDVQGFELKVLQGAVDTLRSCLYVYAECSEVALYEGQPLRTEVVAFLTKHGFSEMGQFNPCCLNGQLIQADYLFVSNQP
jgi:FkbM family methyltransferase